MTSMAAKAEPGTGAEFANHSDSRLTHSRYVHGYETAKLVTGRTSKRDSEASQPESGLRPGGYLPRHTTLGLGDKVVIARIRMDELIEAAPQRPKPQPLKLTAEQLARQLLSAKAFTKHMQHLEYLKRVSTGERALITPETASLAIKAWRMLWLTSGGQIPVPAACTGPDGEMFYSWDRGQYHLELEILPGQPAEFFYRDRITEQFWGEDYTIGEPLPAAVVAKLPLFR